MSRELFVTRLFRYPVKSFRGCETDAMALNEMGPAGDRRWMLVDEAGEFLSQRSEPRLALLEARYRDEALDIRLPDDPNWQSVRPGEGRLSVSVWSDRMEATPAEAGISERISEWLGRAVRLVWKPGDDERMVARDAGVRPHRVSFADGYPFLITHEASLKDLNRRLSDPVTMRRFRPNIVIGGGDPFEEDFWTQIRIANVDLHLVKPCSRCVMTTVNPDTGEKNRAVEPLRELGRFRRTPDGVIFGVNAVHDGEGPISVGDRVHLLGRSP